MTIMENDPENNPEKISFYRNMEYIVQIPADFYKTCIQNGISPEGHQGSGFPTVPTM